MKAYNIWNDNNELFLTIIPKLRQLTVLNKSVEPHNKNTSLIKTKPKR